MKKSIILVLLIVGLILSGCSTTNLGGKTTINGKPLYSLEQTSKKVYTDVKFYEGEFINVGELYIKFFEDFVFFYTDKPGNLTVESLGDEYQFVSAFTVNQLLYLREAGKKISADDFSRPFFETSNMMVREIYDPEIGATSGLFERHDYIFKVNRYASLGVFQRSHYAYELLENFRTEVPQEETFGFRVLYDDSDIRITRNVEDNYFVANFY